MFNFAEMSTALTGAIGLARGDAGAIAHFPNSEPAFWRSFAAIIIVAPVQLFITTLRAGDASEGGYLLAEAIASLALWFTFPIVMIFVTRLLGLGSRFSLFVIAYNWSSVIIIAVLLPSAILTASSTESGAAALFSLVSVLFVLWYAAFLARAALATTWVNAIGIVVLDTLITLLIGGTVLSVAGYA